MSDQRRLPAFSSVLADLARAERFPPDDIRVFYRRVAEAGAETLSVERVSIWLFNDDNTVLRCQDLFCRTEAAHSEGTELTAADYPRYFAALNARRGVAATDARSDAATSELARTYLEPLGITSMLDAAIRRGEELFGVLCHEQVGPQREWTDEELVFAASMADLVALALESLSRKRVEELRQGQNRVLELLATGHPLTTVLEALIETIEAQSEGMIASVLLLDEKGRTLVHGAAPGLPADYNSMVNGLSIGPSVGACGTAAHTGERVITEDTGTDPRWADFREVTRRFNLRSCWSQPILSSERRVLGTFAMYHGHPHRPGPQEIRLIETAASIAGIAIEKSQSDARVEAELERTRDELIRQTRLATIGQVAAGIAHELRNPLGIISSAVYFLERSPAANDAESKKHIGVVAEEVDAADRIIRNLMESTRAKVPEKQDFDLAEVVRDVIARAKETDDVRWTLEFQDEPYMVHADPMQIRQVFRNLIVNAVEAMEGVGEIRIHARRLDGRHEIAVHDSGPGIAPEARHRVFEPLFTTKPQGTGLGLAICRQILHKHDGDLRVETGAKGSRFVMRIPVSPVSST